MRASASWISGESKRVAAGDSRLCAEQVMVVVKCLQVGWHRGCHLMPLRPAGISLSTPCSGDSKISLAKRMLWWSPSTCVWSAGTAQGRLSADT